jgi:chemotaxis methyl-accepting protein methylase
MNKTWRLAQNVLVSRYLWVARRIWKHIPVRFRSLSVLIQYGTHLHSLVLRFTDRRQNHSTFFFRNRAELELMRRLIASANYRACIDIAVFACSKGAEVYSLAWTLRAARPDLTINLRGIDLSEEILEFAEQGVYSVNDPDARDIEDDQRIAGAMKFNWNTYRDQLGYSPFCRMSEHEMNEMFDRDGDCVRVKSWLKEGISWHHADAGDAELMSILGPQDVVVANRFLCHVAPAAAENILRNLGRVVKPGGYLFVSGVDLDVRMRVAMDMKWKPLTDLMEEMHDGDPTIRAGWPLDYWAKEPFQAQRPDAMIRYASAFQIAREG